MAKRFHTAEHAIRLGVRLREARKNRAMSLQNVSRLTSIHHGQISRVERGHMVTAAKNVQKLCTFFNIDLDLGVAERSKTQLGEKIDALLLTQPESREPISRLIAALEDLLNL